MNIDDTYGWWTVVELVKYQGRPGARCRCRCGHEQVLLQSNLRNGHATKCKTCSYANRGPLVAKRITGDHLAAKDKFHDYQTKARKRGIEWNLDYDKFLYYTKQNCFYCGEGPSNINKIPEKEWADDFVYNGLDRLDNSKGYEESNVLPCCKYCNYMKRELSYQDFMVRVTRINQRHNIGDAIVLLDVATS